MPERIVNSDARLFRFTESAHYLGVSLSTLYGFVRRGAIKPITLPGLRGLRFDRCDLESLVEEGRKEKKHEING